MAVICHQELCSHTQTGVLYADKAGHILLMAKIKRSGLGTLCNILKLRN
jgi:hypothetical protein